MAAGLGFKTFATGDVLSAADVNGYLMQGVLVFASAAARNAAITSPQEGQFAFTKDTNGLWYYDGAAWVASGATGDIEGVTAGTGITGGGTSGTVTITNDMATTITAAGDIVVGTGSGTYDNLPIGTTNQILTADTTVSPYKVKWATPAGGGKVAQVVSVTTTSSNSTTSNTYQDCSGLTATITPTASTSKIMVLIQANLNGYYVGDNSGQYDLAIANGSGTVIYDLGRTNWWEMTGSTNKRYFSTVPLMYLHSPATTSATTYKLQMRIRFGGTVSFNDQTNISSITLMEILA
jgi:hypothetical protein